MEIEGISFYESSASWLFYPRFYLLNPIYLSCFVVLEGVCFDESQSIRTQLLRDFRKFILPCLLWGLVAESIRYGNCDYQTIKNYCKSYFIYGPADYYILYMLLLTRLIFKIALLIKNQNKRFLTLLFFSIVGCLVNNYSFSKYWIHAFILCPYIEIGCFYNNVKMNARNAILLCFIYCLCCFVCFCTQIRLPMIHDGNTLSLRYWFLYMVMGSLGSLSLVGVCKYINFSTLQYIGENFVLYVIVHISILFILINFYYRIISEGLYSVSKATLTVFALFVLTVLLSTCLTWFANKILSTFKYDHNN